ncbi:hypothetical protein CHH91_14085 [Virgibacillus sp. 7505]|uniref:hypothetical protein n=1 Tax=Virgibacillus sp. 7505 TaxID=2022548 RepID=UPI000BA7DB28|nr:hypothetical protein [Virgibacillus sp. 7505]PAE15440.1 hypothetical protein CHH91_14085 [Virgibacillus sp. 7505]
MKKKIAFLGVPIIIASSLFIYKSFADDTKRAAADKEVLENELLVISNDFDSTSSLNDMVESSDLVVVGKYTNFDSTWNMARDPENPEEESTEDYVEGKLYDFKVEQTLKGDSQENIRINHLYSETYKVEMTSGDEVVSPEGILLKEPSETTIHEVEKVDPLFIEPNIDDKYILFLNKGEDTGNYFASIEPFSILFNEDNVAELQSNLKGLPSENHEEDHDHPYDDRFTETVKVGEESLDIMHDIHATVDDNLSGEKLETIISEIENIVK